MNLEEIAMQESKFFLLENFWGNESNWSGPYSRNSDEVDKCKSQKEGIAHKYL